MSSLEVFSENGQSGSPSLWDGRSPVDDIADASHNNNRITIESPDTDDRESNITLSTQSTTTSVACQTPFTEQQLSRNNNSKPVANANANTDPLLDGYFAQHESPTSRRRLAARARQSWRHLSNNVDHFLNADSPRKLLPNIGDKPEWRISSSLARRSHESYSFWNGFRSVAVYCSVCLVSGGCSRRL